MAVKKAHLAVLVVALLWLAAGLLIWTPLGRRAERAGTHLAGVVRTATDRVYPRPVILLRIWRRNDEPAFRAEVYRSGSLVVYWRGKFERRLPPSTVDRLLVLTAAAWGDFSAYGCDQAADGINADLYLLVSGHWAGTSCRRSSDWPAGADTRQLLEEMRSLLPGEITIPTRSYYSSR
jgi:hypothetical protein